MGNFVDTILNVMVFIFIGLMIWLYFKKTPVNDHSGDTAKEKDD
jgi:hypothetical protein